MILYPKLNIPTKKAKPENDFKNNRPLSNLVIFLNGDINMTIIHYTLVCKTFQIYKM